MASNSKREQILLKVMELLASLSTVNTVVRVKQSYSDLQQFAVTQLPVLAVVGGLPIPVEKLSARRPGNVDTIVSKLLVYVYVYGMANEAVDSVISDIADDVWAKLYSNQTMDGLCLGMTLKVEEEPQYWHPFYAFQVVCELHYHHDTGGI